MGRRLLLTVLTLIFFSAVSASAADQVLPDIVVQEKSMVKEQDEVTNKPEGLPTKVNIITSEEIEKIPSTGSYLDILRGIPGVKVSHQPRGDMGHMLTMRGFYNMNAVAVFIDGMPLNTLFWPEGQSQIGWIVPEMIERVEVIKGPFSALYGNYALGGVINYITKKSDSSPSVKVSGGTYDNFQGVGVISDSSWTASPFIVLEGYSKDGYRDNDEYERGQAFGKITLPLWGGDLSLRAHHANRDGGFPGYLRIDHIKDGTISRKSATNSSDYTEGVMTDIVVNYSPGGGEEGLHASLYAADLDQTVVGTLGTNPQIRAYSEYEYCGWKLLYDCRPFEHLSLIAGTDLRYDDVMTKYGLKQSDTDIISYVYDQLNTGFFAQAQYKPFPFFKITGGLRYDRFDIDVTNKTAAVNSGDGSSDIWSPKIGFVVTPYKDINIFANKGLGFNSSSVTQLSPYSAALNKNFDLKPAKLDTWDVGINTLLFERLFLSFVYYNTLYQREASYNSSTGLYENLGESERDGFEVETKIYLTKNLNLHGSWAHVRARLKNPATPGADLIANVPEDHTTLGFQFQYLFGGGDHQIGLDCYWLHYGEMPANNTGSLMGPDFNQFMSKLSYKYDKWTFSVDAAFSPDEYAGSMYSIQNDQLAIHSIAELEVMFGLKYQF